MERLTATCWLVRHMLMPGKPWNFSRPFAFCMTGYNDQWFGVIVSVRTMLLLCTVFVRSMSFVFEIIVTPLLDLLWCVAVLHCPICHWLPEHSFSSIWDMLVVSVFKSRFHVFDLQTLHSFENLAFVYGFSFPWFGFLWLVSLGFRRHHLLFCDFMSFDPSSRL